MTFLSQRAMEAEVNRLLGSRRMKDIGEQAGEWNWGQD